jgi:hypothetical protein
MVDQSLRFPSHAPAGHSCPVRRARPLALGVADQRNAMALDLQLWTFRPFSSWLPVRWIRPSAAFAWPTAGDPARPGSCCRLFVHAGVDLRGRTQWPPQNRSDGLACPRFTRTDTDPHPGAIVLFLLPVHPSGARGHRAIGTRGRPREPCEGRRAAPAMARSIAPPAAAAILVLALGGHGALPRALASPIVRGSTELFARATPDRQIGLRGRYEPELGTPPRPGSLAGLRVAGGCRPTPPWPPALASHGRLLFPAAPLRGAGQRPRAGRAITGPPSQTLSSSVFPPTHPSSIPALPALRTCARSSRRGRAPSEGLVPTARARLVQRDPERRAS